MIIARFNRSEQHSHTITAWFHNSNAQFKQTNHHDHNEVNGVSLAAVTVIIHKIVHVTSPFVFAVMVSNSRHIQMNLIILYLLEKCLIFLYLLN